MAEPNLPATPQTFTFGSEVLKGEMLSFNGQSRRRGAVHEVPKRDGGSVEDMGRGPRRLEVRLIFTTAYDQAGDVITSAATSYAKVAKTLDDNPFGLLIHPIAGKWQAFCEGPSEDVNYSQSIDAIAVRVTFIETQLDLAVSDHVPDIATASQGVSDKTAVFSQALAAYVGEFAKARAFEARAVAAIDQALEAAQLVNEPVDFVRDTITSLYGVQSSVLGAISGIFDRQLLLKQDIEEYLNATGDIFTGSDTPTGTSTSAEGLLVKIQTSGDALGEALMAASPTPAGAAEAVGETHELVASCLTLDESIRTFRPPLVVYIVPELLDVMTIARRLYPNDPNVPGRAQEILDMNDTPNPGAIPAGTHLRVAAR